MKMPSLLLGLEFPPLVTPLAAALQFHLSSLKCELGDFSFPSTASSLALRMLLRTKQMLTKHLCNKNTKVALRCLKKLMAPKS